MVFQSPLPDLLIGVLVAAIVLKDGWEVLEHARDARRAAASVTEGMG